MKVCGSIEGGIFGGDGLPAVPFPQMKVCGSIEGSCVDGREPQALDAFPQMKVCGSIEGPISGMLHAPHRMVSADEGLRLH